MSGLHSKGEIIMIGYKCTDMNGCCRGFKFEVGKTYTKDTPKEELECCTDRFFTFVENFLLLKKKVIINLLKADYLKLFLVIMFEKVINMEQTPLQFYVKSKKKKN